MNISLQPEFYKPSLDNNGNYIDSLLSFNMDVGIKCPCMPGKERLFTNKSKFNTHKKTKTHQTWLERMNSEKNNYYVENIKLKELIESQQKIIAKYDLELMKKKAIIEFLSNKSTSQDLNHQTLDLLDL